ncbi:MAG: hypothetical protein IT305_02495 [Chloroflexi bacterium]|nr:hypothetical protein [Chloroflexota bacterium]
MDVLGAAANQVRRSASALPWKIRAVVVKEHDPEPFAPIGPHENDSIVTVLPASA